MNKVVKIVLWFALAVALIAGVQWLTFERQPLPMAFEALESDTQVTVSREPWLTFIPAQNPTQIGLNSFSNVTYKESTIKVFID